MNYIYFKKQSDKAEKFVCDDSQVVVTQRSKWGGLHAWLWFVMQGFRPIREFDVMKNGTVVSRAEVVRHLPIFRFFRKGYHIGPCATIPAERGRGYYPYLLSHICKTIGGDEFYMIVADTNTASLRGVEKAGFVSFAKGRRTRIGLYVVDEWL